MIVTAEHEFYSVASKAFKDSLVVLYTKALGDAATHRVVVHNDDADVARGCLAEFGRHALELGWSEHPDDRDIARPRGERVPGNAVRGISTDKRGTIDPEHGFEVSAYVLAVSPVDSVGAKDMERRHPPRHVVVAGDDYYWSLAAGVSHECSSALELTRQRALRDVTRNDNGVVVRAMEVRLHCVYCFGNAGFAEVEIRDVEDSDGTAGHVVWLGSGVEPGDDGIGKLCCAC